MNVSHFSTHRLDSRKYHRSHHWHDMDSQAVGCFAYTLVISSKLHWQRYSRIQSIWGRKTQLFIQKVFLLRSFALMPVMPHCNTAVFTPRSVDIPGFQKCRCHHWHQETCPRPGSLDWDWDTHTQAPTYSHSRAMVQAWWRMCASLQTSCSIVQPLLWICSGQLLSSVMPQLSGLFFQGIDICIPTQVPWSVSTLD